MSIEVIRDLRGLHSSIARHRNGPLNTAASLAIVPTMGAIHEAHEALVVEAKKNANIVLATIFVNPMQFGENEDLDKYPRSEEEDIKRLEEKGCDIVYIPENKTMYPDGFDLTINVPKLSSVLCGKERKNHFQGVATVVAKLLLQSGADYAIFGEKDYQQLLIIRSLVKNLLLPIEVVSAPTIREDSGLAMSSRNTYLSKSEFRQAPKLYKCIKETIKMIRNGDKDYEQLEKEANIFLEQAGFKVEYYSICDSKTLAPAGDDDAIVLVAAWLGKTRLIDNARVHTYD